MPRSARAPRLDCSIVIYGTIGFPGHSRIIIDGGKYMKRSVITTAVAAGLVVGALVASCSGDNVASDPVAVPLTDGVAIGGSSLSGGGWTPTVAAAASSSDKVAICHSGNGKHFTQITVSVQGARAHLGDPSTGKGGHADDYRVSTNTPCPPPATPGNVQICKVAAIGVAVGANFTFTVAPENAASHTVTVAAGAAPNGTCASAGDFHIGTMLTIAESPQTGIKTTGIVVSPAGAQQGTSDLTAGRATVIVGTGTTTLTYTNQGPTGTLVICKVAGTGIAAGTNFAFAVGGQTQSVAAGAAPNGTCGTALTLGAGAATVTETLPAGTVAQSIAGTPAPTNINLAGGSASILITAGQESRITFTNATATTGTLVICKVAGTGVTVGANFTFTAGAQTQTVAAGAAPNGTCGAPLTFPAGSMTVTETAVAGTSVSAIGGTPAVPTNINLGARSATVAIVAGQETRITFTNVSP